MTGLPERTARRVLNELTSVGLLGSDTPKGAVTLRFPVETLDALFRDFSRRPEAARPPFGYSRSATFE